MTALGRGKGQGISRVVTVCSESWRNSTSWRDIIKMAASHRTNFLNPVCSLQSERVNLRADSQQTKALVCPQSLKKRTKVNKNSKLTRYPTPNSLKKRVTRSRIRDHQTTTHGSYSSRKTRTLHIKIFQYHQIIIWLSRKTRGCILR